MKKSIFTLIPILATGMLAGCGGNQDGPLFKYKDGLIDFGEKFNGDYYPVLSSVDQDLAGEITVALVFEGKEGGWEEVAKEYQRLHNNQVVIKINHDFNAETYPDKVKNVIETSKGNPEWDIIQGNLLNGIANKQNYLISHRTDQSNPYAGNKKWLSFLSGAVDPLNKTIINSENLQTAWFVNTVAMDEAKNNGYTASNPTNFSELISLCESMQKAGYTYPLGLSLDKDSINASQFSWLLRVYGDFYYRNEYAKVTNASDYPDHVYDMKDPDVDLNFEAKDGRLFNLILADEPEWPNYVGAKSNKFKEFVGQFKALAKYINPQAATQSFSQVRNSFSTQNASNSKSSPQIMLDYLGEGLGFTENQNDAFKIDYFDNPRMNASESFVEKDTLLRDVGGNGGYLSITTKSDAAKTNIAQDFIKFFLSPYGQSVYYAKLAQLNLHPQGMTTVKNNLVIIPDKWASFFENNTKVTFSGLCDRNPFISHLIRFLDTTAKVSTEKAPLLWSTLLTKDGTVDSFSKEWDDALFADLPSFISSKKYNPDFYHHPNDAEQG